MRRPDVVFFIGVLVILTITGMGLRALYAGTISPDFDEFFTILGARSILQHGVPITPAGTLYTRGLLYSYLDAISLLLFGVSVIAARLPSVLLGGATILLVGLVGKRMFTARAATAGGAAAAFLAFCPETIIWDGRARMYSLLQFLALLAVFLLYEGAVRDDRGRIRALFAFIFILALLTHLEAVVLLFALAVALLVIRGWRWFLRWDVLLTFGACAGGAIVAYLLERAFLVDAYARSAGVSPFVTFMYDWIARLDRYRLFFTSPALIGCSILVVLSLMLWVVDRVRRLRLQGGRTMQQPQPPEDRTRAFLFIALGVTLLVLVLFASLAVERYIVFLLPLFFLLAAEALGRVWGWIAGWRIPRPGRAIALGLAVLLPAAWLLTVIGSYVSLAPPGGLALRLAEPPQYAAAFEFVRDNWQAGDRILTVAPAISMMYLDRCDGYAIQREYEAYTLTRNGERRDVWVGSPVVDTTAGLIESLRHAQRPGEGGRVWFVADDGRLTGRYQPGYRRVILDNLALVHHPPGVSVYLYDGARPLVGEALEDLTTPVARYGHAGDVILYADPGTAEAFRARYAGPDLVERDLATATPAEVQTAVADLTHAGGRAWLVTHDAGGSARLAGIAQLLEQTAAFPVLYIGGGQVRLYSWPATPQTGPTHSLDVILGDQVRLRGYDLSPLPGPAGDVLHLTLYWQAVQPPADDYVVFVHLNNAVYHLWGSHDSSPARPTSQWAVGETVVDRHGVLVLPGTPPGHYVLEVGMYHPVGGARLDVTASTAAGGSTQIGSSAIVLPPVEVASPTHPANALALPTYPMAVTLGGDREGVRLLGYDLNHRWLKAGQTVQVTLYWQALHDMERDYTVFVHLTDAEGRRAGQKDSDPADGFFPTSRWRAGDVVRDQYTIPISLDTAPSIYQLLVGMYDRTTMQRLMVTPPSPGDAIDLGLVRVLPPPREGEPAFISLAGDELDK